MTFAGPGTELLARVQQAANGTPYLVTPTERGFDVAVDVPNQQWQGLLYRRNVRSVFRHRVAVDEAARKIKITDELYSVEWSAGVAHVGFRISKRAGRYVAISFGRTIGGDGHQRDFTFSSEEGRRLVTDVAKALGWKVGWGAEAKIGLVAAVIGGVSALVVAVLALVGALG